MERLIPVYFSALVFTAGQSLGVEPIDHRPIPELAQELKESGHQRIAQGLQKIIVKDSESGELHTAVSPLMLTVNKQSGEWTISVFNDQHVGSTLLIGNGWQRALSNTVLRLPSFDRTKSQETISKLEGIPATYYPDEIQRLVGESGYQRMFTGTVGCVLDSAFEMVAAHRRYDIDSHIVKLTIEGKEIEVTQGQLRKITENRRTELEKERDRLKHQNEYPDRPSHLNALIEEYESTPVPVEKDSGTNFSECMQPLFADVLVAGEEFVVLIVDKTGVCLKIAFGTTFSERQLNPE